MSGDLRYDYDLRQRNAYPWLEYCNGEGVRGFQTTSNNNSRTVDPNRIPRDNVDPATAVADHRRPEDDLMDRLRQQLTNFIRSPPKSGKQFRRFRYSICS